VVSDPQVAEREPAAAGAWGAVIGAAAAVHEAADGEDREAQLRLPALRELARRLQPFGLRDRAAVVVLTPPRPLKAATEDALARAEAGRATDPRLALAALLGMVNHTAQWYRPRGRLGATNIADGYVDLLLGA